MNDEQFAALVVALYKAMEEPQATPVPSAAPSAPPARVHIAIEKADVDLRHGVIYGTASSLRSDRQDDAVKDDYELEAMAIRFMERQALQKARATDTHGDTIPGTWVASWVERGTWRVGFKPTDRQIAVDAANGEFVGFSIGGEANKED